jgi:hypothetical protein
MARILKNHFKMDLADIRNSKGEYSPELIISKNSAANSNEKGTKIFLKKI